MSDQAAILEREPQLAHLLPWISQAVTTYRSLITAGTNAEFEIRCGTYRNGSFCTGLSRQDADTLTSMLMQAKWDVQTDFSEQHDYYYNTPKFGTVRQEVTVDSNTFVVSSEIEKKRRIWVADCPEYVDVEADVRAQARPDDGTLPCLRACVSTEISIESSEVPKVVNPSCVRIKQRRSFQTGPWKFDISMTWLGLNRTDAEKKQRSSDPTFEIELELDSNARQYLRKHSDDYIAASALLKITDLFPGILFTVAKISQ